MRRMFVAGLVLLAASLARLPVPEGRPSRARRTARRGRAGRRARAAHGAPGDEARELRGGVELVMRFEQAAERFAGTVRNTTSQTVRDARVEIHLSNGAELGPTIPVDMAPGAVYSITMPSTQASFTGWVPHAEVGSGEGSGGGEGSGEHSGSGSEGSGEHGSGGEGSGGG